MQAPPRYRLRLADHEDIAAIAALRVSVGWSVHSWALEAVLEPPARCVVAVADDGEVAAVGSGISYGALGVVGNMVVAAPHRRRGVGSAILGAVLDFLEKAGCTRLELYATADGRPLYAAHGFLPADPSAMGRVPRTIALDADPAVPVSEAAPDDLDALAAYDGPRFGGDRRPLLAMMLADADRPLLVARRRDGTVAGFAWLRAEADRLGPFVADDPGIAGGILLAAFARAPSAAQLTLNLPTANRAGTAWLRGLGVELEPWDGRMGRGPEIARRDDTIYGNAVGALG
jgi:GNAT superfamily N-acetyltransferase